VDQRQVRVWVVDDQPGFRRATAAALDAAQGFVMAGECDTGESAVELIPSLCVDIVLMDIHMPGIGGIEAARRLLAKRPDLTVVLMSTYDVDDLPAAARSCGAASYLHKERLSERSLSRIWRANSAT
jgi:two-component system, NarL family, invasion response regulator UvrY